MLPRSEDLSTTRGLFSAGYLEQVLPQTLLRTSSRSRERRLKSMQLQWAKRLSADERNGNLRINKGPKRSRKINNAKICIHYISGGNCTMPLPCRQAEQRTYQQMQSVGYWYHYHRSAAIYNATSRISIPKSTINSQLGNFD